MVILVILVAPMNHFSNVHDYPYFYLYACIIFIIILQRPFEKYQVEMVTVLKIPIMHFIIMLCSVCLQV